MNDNQIYPRVVKLNETMYIGGDAELVSVVRQFCGDDVADLLTDRLSATVDLSSSKFQEYLEQIQHALSSFEDAAECFTEACEDLDNEIIKCANDERSGK